MDAVVVIVGLNLLISLACWLLAGRMLYWYRWLVVAGDWLEDAELAMEKWLRVDLAIAQKRYQILQLQQSYETWNSILEQGRQILSLLLWLRGWQFFRR